MILRAVKGLRKLLKCCQSDGSMRDDSESCKRIKKTSEVLPKGCLTASCYLESGSQKWILHEGSADRKRLRQSSFSIFLLVLHELLSALYCYGFELKGACGSRFNCATFTSFPMRVCD
ncbi:hypothetical protein O6H91_20G067200 [Diphasiastrum complanatum]|uniref:Uncharacterized protein n=1 Tax=Diphasiastrum complanatum TaxID=34168 RepID=A0ACC2ASY5_DIPCM|nr:hypothetical protein O6H91_20G067200 [Diphasiastrum complanatum]